MPESRLRRTRTAYQQKKGHQDTRKPILELLQQTPEEAWGWVVKSLWLNTFPQGLGGFTPQARESIEKIKKAAEQYFDTPEAVAPVDPEAEDE